MTKEAPHGTSGTYFQRVQPRHPNVDKQYYRNNVHRVASGYSLNDLALLVPLMAVLVVVGITNKSDDWPWLVSMLALNVLFIRIGFGQGGTKISYDILEHMDLASAEQAKDRFRSSWTNAAIVNALLLTFALPMLQMDVVVTCLLYTSPSPRDS